MEVQIIYLDVLRKMFLTDLHWKPIVLASKQMDDDIVPIYPAKNNGMPRVGYKRYFLVIIGIQSILNSVMFLHIKMPILSNYVFDWTG